MKRKLVLPSVLPFPLMRLNVHVESVAAQSLPRSARRSSELCGVHARAHGCLVLRNANAIVLRRTFATDIGTRISLAPDRSVHWARALHLCYLRDDSLHFARKPSIARRELERQR